MQRRSRLRPWMLVSIAWVGPALLAAINPFLQHHIWGGAPDVRDSVFSSLDWLLCAFFTPAIFGLARRWPIARPNAKRRVAFHLAVSLVFCATWAAAGTVLRFLIQPDQLKIGVGKYFMSWFSGTLPFGCAVYLSMVGIEHAIRYFVEAREREVQLARLAEQLTGARLAALQARLNPHFLFNSLNAIAVFVRDGNKAIATRVIEELSELLRLTLGRVHSPEVRLDDELTLVRKYLAVEQARFSDRLRPRFAIAPETEAAAVPSFAVQHLVENAVRHGIGKRTDAGVVIVASRRDGDVLEVTVTDDGIGIGDKVPPAGHGLADTRDRLRTLYGDAASLDVVSISPRGTRAVLRVPFRELTDEVENDVD